MSSAADTDSADGERAGKTILGSGLTLHMTTIVLGLIAVLAYAYFRGEDATQARTPWL